MNPHKLYIMIYYFQIFDRTNHPILISIVANLFMAAGCFFVGPAPFLAINGSLILSQGMVILIGVGCAFLNSSTYNILHLEFLKQGYPDGIETYLVVSGTI